MRKVKNKIITTLLICTSIITLKTTISEAVLESRPDSASLVNKSASEFFALIRRMETSEGPLGLNAVVTEVGTETSNSNNIDVHMIKNTEYGTVGMLAASIYGAKTSNGMSNGTTTGNATGVYQMGTNQNGDKNEYVAGIYGESTSSYIKNIKDAPQKYWDNYTLTKTPKPGDGTLEISWGRTAWISSKYPVFNPYYYSGVFYTGGDSGSPGNSSSRAVVVSGAGL